MNGLPGRLERVEVDALRTDRYLEALLASAERNAADVLATADLDPELRAAVRALRDGAVRVHPSFRFEERLARRLAAAAVDFRIAAAAADLRPAVDRRAIVAGRTGVLPVPRAPDPAGAPLPDPAGATNPALADHDAARPSHPAVRPLLVGGALTSAALSIAGAAFVAWRLARSGALAAAGTAGAAAGPRTELLRSLD